jgi:phosphoglycerate kinase
MARSVAGGPWACTTTCAPRPFKIRAATPFDAGTTAVAKLVAERTAAGKLMSVAGGGDTLAALVHAGVLEQFSYVSTAGGAFLEWLEGKDLPGVAALRRS